MDSPEESTEIIRFEQKYSTRPLSSSYLAGGTFMGRIHELERSNKRARIDYEHELDYTKKQVESTKTENDKLRLDIDAKTTQVMKAQAKLEEVQEKLEKCTRLYEPKIARLTKECRQLEEEKDQLREARSKLEMEKTQEIWRLQKEKDEFERDKEHAQRAYYSELRRSEELKDDLEAAKSQIKDTDDLKSQIKELQKFQDQYEEDAIVLKNLKNQYKNFPQIAEEHAHLKENQDNCLLWKEKYEDASERCEHLTNRLRELDMLVIENEELRRQLTKWTEKTSPVANRARSMEDMLQELANLQNAEAVLVENQSRLQTEARSMEDMLQELANLQNAEAVLVENQSRLQTEVKSLDKALKVKDEQNSELHKQLSEAKVSNNSLQSRLKRLECKTTLIKAERDSYREIIDTYERDCSINLPPELSAGNDQRQVLKEVESQCHELEVQLDAKQAEVHSLQNLIKEMQTQEKKPESTVISETDKKTILQLREQLSQREQKLASVTEEKFQVESVLERYQLRGAYDPRTTKVLQLTANPANIAQTERQTEVERLTHENLSLKERVTRLEENEGRVADLTQQIESDVNREMCSSKKLDDMNAKMKSAELTNARLIEVFKKTGQDLRSACYFLTGYQISVTSLSNYKVTHMYAESPDDYLLFRQDSPGNLQLLETPYSRTLTELMDMYLAKDNSFPPFMSALALELYNCRTSPTL